MATWTDVTSSMLGATQNFFIGYGSTTQGHGQWTGWIGSNFLSKIYDVVGGPVGTGLATAVVVLGAAAVLLLGGKGVLAVGGMI